MKNTIIAKAISELDGYKVSTLSKDIVGFPYRWQFECPKEKLGNQYLSRGNVDNGIRSFNDLPRYTTSYDAILPVIKKTITDWKEFAYILADVMKLKCRPLDMTIAQIVEYVIKATPAQLCEALLRARAKMD